MATIAYLSNTRWPWCTEVHVAQALHRLGHRVALLQEDEVTVDDIRRVALDSDLLLFTRTWGNHDPAAMHALWHRLDAADVPVASYHLDLYVGLERENTISGDPFWATDHVFHPDGSRHAADVLATYGIVHTPLPPCVAATECSPGTPRPEFDHDVVFVGSALPYGHAIEWPFRDRLVNALHAAYGPRFAHYGPGGRRTIRNGIDGDLTALNDLYASARVVVGDCIDRDGYVSDRLTETLGRGGLLVFPRTPHVASLGYQYGEHYLGYLPGNLDSALHAVDRALAYTGSDRDAMRAGAMAHTLAHHTFDHRMATLLDVMGIR
jgi:hypothetical protein